MKKIYCTACQREVCINKDGSIRNHRNGSARCSGSGVRWEAAASSINAHLEIGAVVRVGHDEGVRAVVVEQGAGGTLIHAENGQVVLTRTTRLIEERPSPATKRAWGMFGMLVARSITTTELEALRSAVIKTDRGVVANDKLWVRGLPEGDFVAVARFMEGPTRAICPIESALTTLETLTLICEALCGELEPKPAPQIGDYAPCPVCNKSAKINKTGHLHAHKHPVTGKTCPYYGTKFIEPRPTASTDVSFEEPQAPLPDQEALRAALEPTASLPLDERVALNDEALEELARSPMMEGMAPDTRLTLTDKGRAETSKRAPTSTPPQTEGKKMTPADQKLELLISILRVSPSGDTIRRALDIANGTTYTDVRPNDKGAYVDDRRRHYSYTRWVHVEHGRWVVGTHSDWFPDLETIYAEGNEPQDSTFKKARTVEGYGAYSLGGDIYITFGLGETPEEAVYDADINMIHASYVEQGERSPYLGLDACHAVFAVNEDGELEVAVIPFSVARAKEEALDIADLPNGVAIATVLYMVEPVAGYVQGFHSAQAAANCLMDLVEARTLAH